MGKVEAAMPQRTQRRRKAGQRDNTWLENGQVTEEYDALPKAHNFKRKDKPLRNSSARSTVLSWIYSVDSISARTADVIPYWNVYIESKL